MEIGVKYCGGCSLNYDRKQALEVLKKNIPEADFVRAEEKKFYKFIIVLNGCQRQCADISRLICGTFISIYQDTDLMVVIKDIKNG